MKKRLSLTALACSLVLLFALSPIANATKTISLWTGYPENLPVFKAAAEDYMKENPGVKIEVTGFNLRDSEQKYSVALPAGTAPELCQLGSGLTKQFATLGALDPVPDEIAEWVKANWDPVFIDTLTTNGVLYAIPLQHGFQILYYNIDHYEEVGLTSPPETLDELMDHARKLAKYDSSGNLIRSGVSLRISGGGMGVAEKFEVFLFANGGSVIKETAPGKWEANFANEAGVKALNFYLQALHKYKVDSYNIKHDSEAFVMGVTSQFNRETWVIGELAKSAPDMRYGITQLPGGDVQRATNLALDGLVVPANAKNKDIAWDFAKYLNRDKYLVQVMKDVGWIFTRNGVDYTEAYEKDPHFAQALDRGPDFKLIPMAVCESSAEVYTKFASRLVDAFADASMVDNEAKIMQFLQESADEVNEILRSYDEYGD